MQALDGNLLDEGTCVPDLEELLLCLHEENHLLTGQCLLDVIRLQVDIDTAIRADATGKCLPMNALEPAIRIDGFRHRSKIWQGWMRDTWRSILAGSSLMRTLLIGMLHKALCHLTNPLLVCLADGSASIPGCNCDDTARRTHFCLDAVVDTHWAGCPGRAKSAAGLMGNRAHWSCRPSLRSRSKVSMGGSPEVRKELTTASRAVSAWKSSWG